MARQDDLALLNRAADEVKRSALVPVAVKVAVEVAVKMLRELSEENAFLRDALRASEAGREVKSKPIKAEELTNFFSRIERESRRDSDAG